MATPRRPYRFNYPIREQLFLCRSPIARPLERLAPTITEVAAIIGSTPATVRGWLTGRPPHQMIWPRLADLGLIEDGYWVGGPSIDL